MSRATSLAHLNGPGTRLTHHGYGEAMPLDQITLPFEGDHWWYPLRTYWRIRAEFDGETREVGGGAKEAEARFREQARPSGDHNAQSPGRPVESVVWLAEILSRNNP